MVENRGAGLQANTSHVRGEAVIEVAMDLASMIAASEDKGKLESRFVCELLRILGIILVLGGLGHSIGVIHLYIMLGVPDINRVLLDTWVGEAQIIGGGLYFAAFRAIRTGSAWNGFAIAGALTVLAYAVPFIPVLFVRAPVIFRIPPMVYALLSVSIALRAARSMRTDREPHAAVAANGRSKTAAVDGGRAQS